MIFSVYGAFGQAPASLSFDVASVKASAKNGPERGRDRINTDPGGITMMNVRLKSIIQWAYHLQTIQVTGPDWLDGDRFDVVAKASAAVSNEQLRQMTRTLLTQRFKLTFHKETKVMPAYVVTVAKGGYKMKPSEGEGDMQIKPGPNPMVANFTHVTLAELSEMVSSPLQGVVVDETGLKGAWDFTLDATSFATAQPSGIDDMINLIIQALNEQIGIKIEQKKVPAEVLVVDHAERVPVEN